LWAGVAMFVAIRFAMGAAQAPLYPIMSGVCIAAWFPMAAWGLINSIPTTALNLGAAASAPLVAWLTARAGWRESVVLTAPSGIVSAILWWWLYRDDPTRHKRVNAAEVDLIRVGRPAEAPAAAAPAAGAPAPWRLVLSHRGLLAITLSYFCMN